MTPVWWYCFGALFLGVAIGIVIAMVAVCRDDIRKSDSMYGE